MSTVGIFDFFGNRSPEAPEPARTAPPRVIMVLTVAAAKGSVMFGMVGLAAFALGRSIPVLLLGLFSGQVLALPKIHRVAPICVTSPEA